MRKKKFMMSIKEQREERLKRIIGELNNMVFLEHSKFENAIRNAVKFLEKAKEMK